MSEKKVHRFPLLRQELLSSYEVRLLDNRDEAKTYG